MSTRTRTRNAFEDSLNGSITSGAATITLNSTTGLVDPLYLVIDPESPTKREYIRVGSVSGSNLESVDRGEDGSASGAQAHDSGITVRAVWVHQVLDELFTDIEALETADTNHFGGTDTADHPEATTGVRGFMSAAHKFKLDGIAIGAVADHGFLTGLTLGDDHTQYLKADGTRFVGGDLLPDVDVTRDLGDAVQTWRRGYFEGIFDPAGTEVISLDNIRLIGGVWAATGLNPETDIAHDLGDASFSWNRLYAQDLYDAGGGHVVSMATRSLVGDWKGEDFDPAADNAHDLGNATSAWRDLFTHSIRDESGLQIIDTSARLLQGVWKAGGDFDPNSDIASDLGSSTKTWRRAYVNDLYDDAGLQYINGNARKLVGGVWDVDGDLLPDDDNTHDLGSGTRTWARVYAQSVYTENGQPVWDTSQGVFFDPDDGTRMFRMSHGGNGERMYGRDDTIWFEQDETNEWFQFFINSVEVMRIGTSGILKTVSGTIGTF
jgi:hypothetical protein